MERLGSLKSGARRIELPVFGQPLWYLGLDIGSCGVRAVLCEQRRRQCYPLQWLDDRGGLVSELPLAFRWSLEPGQPQGIMPVLAAPDAVAGFLVSVQALEVDRFKAYLLDPIDQPSTLQRGTEFSSALQVQPWEQVETSFPQQRRLPRLRLGGTPDTDQPLGAELAEGLVELLHRLSPDFLEAFPGLCQHPLLTTEEIPQILRQLTGVIVNCPSDAPASYRSLLREAVLQAKLVDLPSRIVFLEESIASLLGHAPLPSGQILVVHGSYSRTELSLLSVPQGSTAAQGILGFNWGQIALTQAIVGQLLYPLLPHDSSDRSPLDTFHLPEIPPFLIPSEGGIPVASLRYHQTLQWRLQQSPLGNILLQAADRLQNTLQHQEQFTLRIGQQTHILAAQAWQTEIVQPYHRTLQQTLQTLLQRAQLGTNSIDYLLGTGSLGKQPWILQGLQSLCPQAKVLETESADLTQVALGLAQFPLYGATTALS